MKYSKTEKNKILKQVEKHLKNANGFHSTGGHELTLDTGLSFGATDNWCFITFLEKRIFKTEFRKEEKDFREKLQKLLEKYIPILEKKRLKNFLESCSEKTVEKKNSDLEKIKNLTPSTYFSNTMGPGRIESVTVDLKKEVYKIKLSCNVFGHGGQSKIITFDPKK